MKTIRISDEVWDAMAKHGKFGETPDDVFRRILKIDGNINSEKKQRKTGKVAFIDDLLAANGSNRKTKREIIELFRKQFPDVQEKTAKNSVFWCASTFRKRTGKEPNYLAQKI